MVNFLVNHELINSLKCSWVPKNEGSPENIICLDFVNVLMKYNITDCDIN